jgi:hypothetical protein
VGVEGSEGVGFVAVFKQGILHRCPVDGAQQRTAQDACHSHHVEGVEGEVMEALDEQDESEDGCYPEARGEEPRRLSQGVHQEY